MPRNKTTSATNARLLRKSDAFSICRDAMTKMLRNCVAGREYELEIPDGSTAEDVAGAVGGVLVSTATRGALSGVGIGTRIAVVRLSVGLLTSSLAAQSAEAVTAYSIEAAALPALGAVSKVALPILNGSPLKQAFAEVASTAQKATAVAGEAVATKAGQFSQVAVQFAVILEMINVLQRINADLRGETEAKAENIARSECCNAINAALKSVWKDLPKKFHEASIKTDDNVTRYYGKKAGRKN